MQCKRQSGPSCTPASHCNSVGKFGRAELKQAASQRQRRSPPKAPALMAHHWAEAAQNQLALAATACRPETRSGRQHDGQTAAPKTSKAHAPTGPPVLGRTAGAATPPPRCCPACWQSRCGEQEYAQGRVVRVLACNHAGTVGNGQQAGQWQLPVSVWAAFSTGLLRVSSVWSAHL